MKKLLTLLTLLVVSLSLIACDNDENVLVVGMEAAYAPFNWATNTANEFTHPLHGTSLHVDGYDVQLARKMAEALGMELRIRSFSWTGLIPALETGQIDAIIAGMTATDTRREVIDFTNTYWTSDIVGLIRTDSIFANATTVAELDGARAVAQINTIYDTMYNQIPNGVRVSPLDDYAQLSAAILAGTADIVIGEYPVIALAAAANDNLTYITFTQGYGFVIERRNEAGEVISTATRADVAIGVRQSEPNTRDRRIRDTMNEVLATLSETDRYAIMNAAILRHTPSGLTPSPLITNFENIDLNRNYLV